MDRFDGEEGFLANVTSSNPPQKNKERILWKSASPITASGIYTLITDDATRSAGFHPGNWMGDHFDRLVSTVQRDIISSCTDIEHEQAQKGRGEGETSPSTH